MIPPIATTVSVALSIALGACALAISSGEAAFADATIQGVARWPMVSPVDFSKLSAADFSDDELDLIEPLAHFSTFANAVVEEGPDRGFFNISVWRRAQENRTYNARVMENILSLAWFYTADRKWNPWRGDPAVRVRLEAALDFISRIQAPDGSFSEYGPQRWNIAATAFMTKFLGRALEHLSAPDAPPVNKEVLAHAHKTCRKALLAALARDDYYERGLLYSNQYGNIWPGGLSWFAMHDNDRELKALWEKRLRQSAGDFQSPAGFFYEQNGPDFQYTLGTHGTNTRSAWPRLRHDASLARTWIRKESAWFEWLAYNAVLQPGENWIAVNCAIESRTRLPFFPGTETPVAEFVDHARAFSPTREERAAGIAATRARLAREWPPRIRRLQVPAFDSFSPYTFLDHRDPAWYPSRVERDAAREQLPWAARQNFNHIRHDPRQNSAFLYLRRPGWYASFAFGNPASRQQRYGLGFVWRPDTGILLQSQSRQKSLAWGTYAEKSDYPFEALSFDARMAIANHPVSRPFPPAADLKQGDLALAYSLYAEGKPSGSKKVLFTDDGIDVSIGLSRKFAEHFPLVLAHGDTITIRPDAIVVRRMERNSPLLTIAFRGASGIPVVAENATPLPGRRLMLLKIPSAGQLDYTLHF
ncbi:hypothetical protein OPIT5_18195 [Opitutaceae bacterium TAV5]|nr:hypothetical protein OPIT5_18195 [Opitutaceae bacterium TAV5]